MAVLDSNHVSKDADSEDEECEVIKTGSVVSPRAVDPDLQAQKKQEEEEEEEYNEKLEKKRQRIKNRVKTAVQKTGKVVTSSYTCAACISISGLVTMICGIIMLSISNRDSIRSNENNKNFMLVGGSIFFLFGLAMIIIAIVYTVVHYLRKRAKEAKDPFELKAQEKNRKEREKAMAEGRAVTPIAGSAPPAAALPVCSAEHEHDVVAEKRIKEARRQSLFLASSATPNDVTSFSHPPLKKSQSAFDMKVGSKKGNTRLPSIQSASQITTFGGAPLPPINPGGQVLELDELDTGSPSTKKTKSRTSNNAGFPRSKSEAVITETEVVDMTGNGPDFGIDRTKHLQHRRGSAFELGHSDSRPNSGNYFKAPALNTITDVTDFE